MTSPTSEVKGIWFASLRGYLEQEGHRGALPELLESLPAAAQAALADPLVSAWYPEDALAVVLDGVHRVTAGGSDAHFEELMEAVTIHGVSRFFRVLLQLSTPGFVVGKIPVLWDRMRRGAGKVEVDRDAVRARVYYTRFPYFDAPVYRLLTTGSIRGITRICGGMSCRIEALRHTHDSLDVEVTFGR